jgi:hypothetical protein
LYIKGLLKIGKLVNVFNVQYFLILEARLSRHAFNQPPMGHRSSGIVPSGSGAREIVNLSRITPPSNLGRRDCHKEDFEKATNCEDYYH